MTVKVATNGFSRIRGPVRRAAIESGRITRGAATARAMKGPL